MRLFFRMNEPFSHPFVAVEGCTTSSRARPYPKWKEKDTKRGRKKEAIEGSKQPRTRVKKTIAMAAARSLFHSQPRPKPNLSIFFKTGLRRLRVRRAPPRRQGPPHLRWERRHRRLLGLPRAIDLALTAPSAGGRPHRRGRNPARGILTVRLQGHAGAVRGERTIQVIGALLLL